MQVFENIEALVEELFLQKFVLYLQFEFASSVLKIDYPLLQFSSKLIL